MRVANNPIKMTKNFYCEVDFVPLSDIRPPITLPEPGGGDGSRTSYTLTTEIVGPGRVSSDGIYLSGAEVTLTAIPDAGASLKEWSGDPDCADGKVTMDRNKTCEAVFAKSVGIGNGKLAYWEQYLASYPGSKNLGRTWPVSSFNSFSPLVYSEDGVGGFYTPIGAYKDAGWYKDPIRWTDKFVNNGNGSQLNPNCKAEVYHSRRNIGDLKPGQTMGIGVGSDIPNSMSSRPTYFISGDAHTGTFTMDWYLDTGELKKADGGCDTQVRRVIWPGEVTDDGWAIVPTSDNPDTAKFIFLVPAHIDPDKVVIRNFTDTNPIPLSSFTGGIPFRHDRNIVKNCPFDECYIIVMGGDGGPKMGSEIPGSDGRATYERVGDTIRIYITGVGTGITTFYDVPNGTSLAAGFSSSVGNAVADFIRDLNISRGQGIKIELYGHSLGAAEATWIYQNGSLRKGDKVIAIGVPAFVRDIDMISGKNGIEYKGYCGIVDVVCQLFGEVLRSNVITINTLTGMPGTRYLNSHARNNYQIIIGLPLF